jgi:hypothetical protein
MGVAVANLKVFESPNKRPFFETLVQLIIGVLFVTISATVTPESLEGIVLPTLGLVAVLVVITRPLVAFLATIRTELTTSERAFIGWMAPRGIVAAATASTFGVQLAAHHIGGASKILPVTFLVIVATVALYGLTATPVARRLGVTRPSRSRLLLIGGDPWVLELARALKGAGVEVLMWASSRGRRAEIQEAGLETADGEILASVAGRNAEREGITAVLLLTDEDHYNSLAALTLDDAGTEVYRLAPAPEDDSELIPGVPLFAPDLRRPDLAARYQAGARITTLPSPGAVPRSAELLFLINTEGKVVPVTPSRAPDPEIGDTLVLLSGGSSPHDGGSAQPQAAATSKEAPVTPSA